MSTPVVDLIPERLVGYAWVLDAVAKRGGRSGGAHAFLLTGPAHTGKFATAMTMARLFLCESTPACGECRHCRLIQRGVHPDVKLLEMPSDRKSIPVKDVHDFLQGIALKPLEAATKVYVIRDADDLTEEGANALLKTIEEPPAAVKLILTAASPSSVLPTIVSRCQPIALPRVPTPEIAGHLTTNLGVDAERAHLIAQASHGLVGWAILAASGSQALEERLDRARDLVRLVRDDRIARIRYADELSDRWTNHPDEVQETIETWADVWRDAILLQSGLSDRASIADALPAIGAMASELGPAAAQAALARTIELATALDRNAHPRLALETHCLQLPRLASADVPRR